MNDLTIKGRITIDNMELNHIEGGFGKDKKSMLAKDIAKIHDRELKTINQAINMNKNRFKDGIDIFDLRGTKFVVNLIDHDIYTQNAINRSNNIYLLSERGYAKLLKILEDDFAWEQYEKLVDEYFNMREVIADNQISNIQPKNNQLELHKQNLEKAVITSNYLIDYIKSVNGQIPESLLESFTTAIQAVNIDIIDHLRTINKIGN